MSFTRKLWQSLTLAHKQFEAETAAANKECLAVQHNVYAQAHSKISKWIANIALK